MNAIIYIILVALAMSKRSKWSYDDIHCGFTWRQKRAHINDRYMYCAVLYYLTSVSKLKYTSSGFDRGGTQMTIGEVFLTSILSSLLFVCQGKEASYNCRGIAETLCIGKGRDSAVRRSTKEASAGSLDKRLDPFWSSRHEPPYLAECC